MLSIASVERTGEIQRKISMSIYAMQAGIKLYPLKSCSLQRYSRVNQTDCRLQAVPEALTHNGVSVLYT